MHKTDSYRAKTLVIASILLLFIATQSGFAQCANYFKTNYRAAGKLRNANDYIFLLDDWTGDGKLDHWNFQLNSSTSTQNIIIYPSKSTGYWDWENPIIYSTAIPSSVKTSSNNISLEVKDFNSDGRTDILVKNAGSNSIHFNNGNGTLTALTTFSYPQNSQLSVGFYDLNGDGYLDWVTATGVPQVGRSIGYQLGNADGSFGSRVSLAENVLLNSSTFAVGDFDGDGKKDIVYNYRSGTNNIYVYLKNMGGGTFETKTPQSYAAVGSGNIAKTADFNGDGKLDILAYYYQNTGPDAVERNVYILYGQGNSTFVKSSLSVNLPSKYATSEIAEMNGDARPDIIEYSEGFYSVYANNGETFTRTDYNRYLSDFTGPILISDFSADNKADIIFMGTRRGNIFGEQITTVKENVCQPVGETKTQDFTGDQIGDVVYWNGSNGNWTYYNGDWTGAVGRKTSFSWGSASLGDIPSVGDFDGDGKSDYSVYRNSTGVWYVFRSSDSSWQTFQFGATGDVPVPGDYDGGGKTDFAVWRPSTGVWYVWYNETQQFYAVQFGQNGDKTTAADYDGDGKTDVSVWRPDTGVWYYLRSSDGGFAALQWGISTDKPVPADFDGDGKADVTVYRNGIWYVLRSNTNSFSSVTWGLSTDIPIPFYRNTDVAEFVVFRPSNGILYNFNFPTRGIGFDASQNTPIATTLPRN